jgi:hypothetical protein
MSGELISVHAPASTCSLHRSAPMRHSPEEVEYAEYLNQHADDRPPCRGAHSGRGTRGAGHTIDQQLHISVRLPVFLSASSVATTSLLPASTSTIPPRKHDVPRHFDRRPKNTSVFFAPISSVMPERNSSYSGRAQCSTAREENRIQRL